MFFFLELYVALGSCSGVSLLAWPNLLQWVGQEVAGSYFINVSLGGDTKVII
jgi:hypothetical protein